MTMQYERVFGLEEEALRCPWEAFKEARNECPVSHNPNIGFWVVSDQHNAVEVFKDTVTFSTKQMLGPDVSAEWQLMIDLAAKRPEAKELGADYGSSPRKVLLFADPPDHGHHRKLIMGALTPAAVRSWEPRIQETAQRFVQELAEKKEVEFVEEFANKYTMTVIADVLGLPRSHVAQMLDWAADFNSMVGNPHESEEEVAELVDTRLGFDKYFNDQIEQRIAKSAGDLISRVLELNDAAEEPLSRDDLFQLLQLVMVGGSDTSSTALSTMIQHLAIHPGQWTDLRGNPDAIPAFMEEMLRTQAPVQGVFRGVTRDVELGGEQLKAGDMVWVSIGAANRDPAVFQEPDEMDVSRRGTITKYVSFGGGPHTCPGTALTRLELRTVLRMLTQQFSRVELVGDVAPSKKSFLFFGPEALRVRFVE